MNRYSLFLLRLVSILIIAFMPESKLYLYADNDGVNINGSIINYGSGGNGIYSFNTLKPGILNPIKLTDNLCAEGGATLAGSNYYVIRADKTLHVYDVDTWEELYSRPITNVSLDMTYDETTKQIYGCFVDNGAQLGILLPQEGTYKKIGAMQVPACIMVCDAEGVLYAVGHDGILYSVDKNTAEMKEIGNTNIMPMFAQSAAIDPNTGLCYWVSLSPDASSCLVELDLKTAETGWIYDMPNGEEVTGLFIIPEAHEKAPGKATDMKMDDGENNVVFTAPTMTVDGSTLPNEKLDYTVEVYTQQDRTVVSEDFSAMPGEKLSYPIKKTTGQIKISVIFKNNHGNGEKAILFFWMGEDYAGAVRNLEVNKESNTSARISWDNPEEGQHGGDFDISSIRYKVTRFPDNVVLCEDFKENMLVDKIEEEELKKYWYEVVPFTGDDNKQGVTARTNDIVLGNPYELPYSEMFGKQNNKFDIFTVYDVNKDGDTWYYDDYAEKVKFAGNSEYTADDWLVTPPVHIKSGYVCTLSFFATVGFEGLYTEHLVEVAMGNKPGIKDLDVQLMPVTKLVSTKGQEVKVKFETTKDDEYYFGIHLVSDGHSLEFSVDNIKIEKKASIEGPAAVSDFNVIAGEKGSLKADISFTAPTTAYNGKQLSDISKIEVYRDKEIIKTFTGVNPGDKLSLEDTPRADDLYCYKVICYNDKGSGDEAEIKIFIGVDVPGEVQNINVSENNEGMITITWEAPSCGMNGGYIESNTLKYTVLRNGWKPIAEATSETTAIDPMEDLIEGKQGIMQYQILVKTDAGRGADAYSPFVTAGKPYKVPFIESFISGLCRYEPWSSMPHTNGCIWRYDRYTDNEPVDGDKGMMAYTTQNEKPVHSMMLSPKVRISDTVKPLLSFWLANSCIDDEMAVEIWTENKPIEIVKKIDLRKESEWTEYTIDLSPYKETNSIQFAFHITNAVKGDKLHIDNLRITDNLTHNLAASEMKAPLSLAAGKEGILEVKVINYGKETADNYSVDFYNGDKLINNVQGFSVDADSTVSVKSVFTPQITDMDTMSIHAVIIYDDDENMINNTSETVSVKILVPEYPLINDLKGSTDGKGNNLTWSVPDISTLKPSAITDSFEEYESFTIDNFGDWTLVDVDQNQNSMEFKTSTNEWITFPNSGGPMSFQVVDLSKIKGTAEDGWSSVTGDKILICPYASNNDDWLISPELYPVEQEIAVHAKSLNYYEYGLESFTVLYSTTNKDVSSFVEVGKATDIPTKWTEYRFTIPSEAKYFAVRANNTNSALFIDDVSFIPSTAKPVEINIEGYNVYRDHEKINTAIVNTTSYTDNDVENAKEYTYSVTVMYDLGESGFSNEVTVTADTGIEDIEDAISIQAIDGKIVITGATGYKITIYAINGIAIAEKTGSETTTFDVQQGVYIVKVNGNIYKVDVR